MADRYDFKIQNFQGDCHNFGYRVGLLSDDFMSKPRPTIWEHLILDTRSPIRQILQTSSLFNFLPSLHVAPEFNFFQSAVVERVNIRNVDAAWYLQNLDQIGESSGAMMALAVVMGFADLHYENILFGESDGRLILAPIDLECALKRVNLPTASMLLSTQDVHPSDAGFNFAFRQSATPGFVTRICYGYITALCFLEDRRKEFYSILKGLEGQLYSRVMLAGTENYGKLLRNEIRNENLIREEKLQLDRGDIPNSFRRVDRKELLYFDNERKIAKVESIVEPYVYESQRILEKAWEFQNNLSKMPTNLALHRSSQRSVRLVKLKKEAPATKVFPSQTGIAWSRLVSRAIRSV